MLCIVRSEVKEPVVRAVTGMVIAMLFVVAYGQFRSDPRSQPFVDSAMELAARGSGSVMMLVALILVLYSGMPSLLKAGISSLLLSLLVLKAFHGTLF